jgi:cytochrome bd-type quinol oxidase subunit 1
MVSTVYTPLVVYIIGLIIAFRREGVGGWISLVFIAFGIIFHRIDLHALAEEKEVMVILTWLMFLPCILYILSWYFHRRLARQHQIPLKA